MDHNRQSAATISYAQSADSKRGQSVIKLLENVTGRLALIRRAHGYQDEVAQGRDFWQVIVERYGLSLDIRGGSINCIPKTGPLILVANHPYGILDGVMLSYILSVVRGDFRVLAHEVFQKSKALETAILPIKFDATKDAVRENLQTRKKALRFLAKGGAIGVFPGGTVSTARTAFARPIDPSWRSFTARMILKSNAAVVPIFFDGHNSRLFQMVSRMHSTLRLGLLMKEFHKRIDRPVRVVIGQPIPQAEMQNRSDDARALMDFLRKSTYDLSPKPLTDYAYGYEFDQKYKQKS
jgi:putative hemolysin